MEGESGFQSSPAEDEHAEEKEEEEQEGGEGIAVPLVGDGCCHVGNGGRACSVKIQDSRLRQFPLAEKEQGVLIGKYLRKSFYVNFLNIII